MLSLLLPPGSIGGPCASELCGHPSCGCQRDAATIACSVCGKPIGYGVLFALEVATVTGNQTVHQALQHAAPVHYACRVDLAVTGGRRGAPGGKDGIQTVT